jgi:hypothetical protein
VIRGLSWSLALLLILSRVAVADQYDFSIPEADPKPYHLGGRLEFRYLHHYLDSDSARYKLNYYDSDPGSYTQEWRALTEIRGDYRYGILQANFLTHHEYARIDGQEDWIHDLYEGYLALTPSVNFTFEAGKKSILWGKGYAWNPAGFINRPKDPIDPELNLEGRIILGADIIKSVATGIIDNVGLTAYALPVIEDWANPELGRDGDISYALKLYLLWRDTDLDFIYFDGPGQPRSVGFDFAKNLAENIEIHGELAFRKDARRTVIDEAGTVTMLEEGQLSYLLGLRYLNAVETTFIAEYYHNGAGYSRSELDDFFFYQESVYNQWLATGNAAIMDRANQLTRPYYSQRNFGKDYFYLKIIQKEPFNILYFNPWLAVIVNLQDFSFNLQPGMTWAPVTNFELGLRVGIPIGSAHTEFGEKQDAFRPELRVIFYF